LKDNNFLYTYSALGSICSPAIEFATELAVISQTFDVDPNFHLRMDHFLWRRVVTALYVARKIKAIGAAEKPLREPAGGDAYVERDVMLSLMEVFKKSQLKYYKCPIFYDGGAVRKKEMFLSTISAAGVLLSWTFRGKSHDGHDIEANWTQITALESCVEDSR
jgi:hypothetical protein